MVTVWLFRMPSRNLDLDLNYRAMAFCCSFFFFNIFFVFRYVHYSVSKKNPPAVFWFFSKRLGIFLSIFIHPLYVPLYTRLQLFI